MRRPPRASCAAGEYSPPAVARAAAAARSHPRAGRHSLFAASYTYARDLAYSPRRTSQLRRARRS
eukprot:1069464-Prymnesium_polylepis.1